MHLILSAGSLYGLQLAYVLAQGLDLISICINFGAKSCAYYFVSKWWKENFDNDKQFLHKYDV